MQSLACLNGELMPVEEARVPVWDRGFLFGDAIYEVFRLYAGRPWLEAEHLARLRRSLDEIEIAGVDVDALTDRMRRTASASAIQEGTLYVQITRGVAPRAHVFPPPGTPPTELIVVRPYDDAATARLRDSGASVITRPDLRWGRCDVKSTNLLANVLAVEAAKRAGAIEAVLYDDHGQVTEATHSSVLWVRAGRLGGTPEGPEILPSTTRGLVRRLAASAGLPIDEADRIALDDFREADEILLVGTTIEVLPVVAIDGAPVGDGRPGPIARRLQEAFRRAVAEWLTGSSM